MINDPVFNEFCVALLDRSAMVLLVWTIRGVRLLDAHIIKALTDF